MKKQFLLFILILTVLGGCSDSEDTAELNNNYLKQGWQLSQWSINGTTVDISGIPLSELMYFTDQNLCYLAIPSDKSGVWTYTDIRTAWNYDYLNAILNIASVLPVTYYVNSIENDRLQLHYYVNDDTGKLNTYEKEFIPAKTKVIDLKLRLSE